MVSLGGANVPPVPTRAAGVHKPDKTILVPGFFQESRNFAALFLPPL